MQGVLTPASRASCIMRASFLVRADLIWWSNSGNLYVFGGLYFTTASRPR